MNSYQEMVSKSKEASLVRKRILVETTSLPNYDNRDFLEILLILFWSKVNLFFCFRFVELHFRRRSQAYRSRPNLDIQQLYQS